MSHHRQETPRRLSLALLTISDTRTLDDDRSGSTARRLIEAAGHEILDYRILPDEPEAVRGLVEAWLQREACDGVVTSGGTGVSRRDRTFEALCGLFDKRLDGFGELFRMLSFEQVGSAAMLSRALGGTIGRKFLFALPGSPQAVELALDRLILPELTHLANQLEG